MSLITAALIVLCIVPLVASYLKPKKGKDGKQAPGPRQWPIIGNLFYIGKFRDLIEAFSSLTREYGDTVSIKLGHFDAIVVSGLKNFREVLINQGQLFDGRPDFLRYSMLFGNDKDNSMAFAAGSDAHQKTRNLAAGHTFMRNGSALFENLESSTTEKVYNFMEELKIQTRSNNKIDIKARVAEVLSSVFIKTFFSTDVDIEDPSFKIMVQSMDDIFQEINEGCIGDVLPYLMRFISKSHVVEAAHKVRDFLVTKCVEPRLAARENLKSNTIPDENNNCKRDQDLDSQIPNDLLNTFLDEVEQSEELTLDRALFCLEDILGGHAAISNVLVRIIYHLAKNPEVQQKIREEIASTTSGCPTMSDRLTYTEATIWEAIRFISSAIVPHMATSNTNIDDFSIKKGTLVFFNNYDLNFSPELWDEPEKFKPERFISEAGRILKPEYFIPFSLGRRGCLGYKLMLNLGRVIIANLCQNFEIDVDPSMTYDIPRGFPAVGRKAYTFIYNPID